MIKMHSSDQWNLITGKPQLYMCIGRVPPLLLEVGELLCRGNFLLGNRTVRKGFQAKLPSIESKKDPSANQYSSRGYAASLSRSKAGSPTVRPR